MSPQLPIDCLQHEFLSSLAKRHLVVSAATGSGKSTRLPLWARQLGPVLVVEPRRVACTALAAYVAELAGSALGEEVGYAIRFEQRCSEQTRVLFVTPGVALRWLVEGRLERFQTVLLDEFHERRWDTDLLLALLKAQDRHRLVLTSATLAGERLADYLEADLLEAEGRNFPVSVSHQAADSRQMPSLHNLSQQVRGAAERMLADSDGDLLVFLPGRREIAQAQAALAGLAAELLPLHAGVDAAGQRRALNRADRRRIILATNVAETSLTIPGVTAVVDSGLERRTHQRNGRTVLSLQPISKASAEQRKGRAGRLAPGRCIRLWGEHAPLEQVTPPQIQREELTELVLAAACCGYSASELAFADPLPAKSLATAEARLREMNAIDQHGLVTDHGRALFPLPIDTAFAHLISLMPDEACRGAMVDLAAALSVGQRLFRLPTGEQERRELQQWLPQGCDASTLIALLRKTPPECLATDARLREEARQLAAQIRRQLNLPALPDELDFDAQRWRLAAMRADPARVFIRRAKRRDAMGNGFAELQPGRDSRFADEAEAALVFDEHSVPGSRGTRQTLTIGTCMAPVSLAEMVRAGLGDVRPGDVQWQPEDAQLWLVVERHYAGRLIGSELEQPQGELARRALAELILSGRLMAGVGERLRDDLAAWALFVALGEADGEVPEPQAWLQAQLERLGVEQGGDIELIEPDDLRFEGIPDWQRAAFDGKYPRRLSLGDMALLIHYDVARRVVTAEKIGGLRKSDPKRWELPGWSGWKVRFKKASRVVDIR
ncbi:helicase-related protein [Marinobacterium arenosum]|uniref:helicase-related protein n=1 Tax=Marinobacterium arenosum TaxID=2862496 RepID=UPI001C97B509|nr:helicase-related protein [Marinobacterium arenosum]MBY4675101.1 hypothetical protein [Marinobacterium arenosum]